jgi:hypothetical protein
LASEEKKKLWQFQTSYIEINKNDIWELDNWKCLQPCWKSKLPSSLKINEKEMTYLQPCECHIHWNHLC